MVENLEPEWSGVCCTTINSQEQQVSGGSVGGSGERGGGNCSRLITGSETKAKQAAIIAPLIKTHLKREIIDFFLFLSYLVITNTLQPLATNALIHIKEWRRKSN